jgi:hypothetical protein
VPRVRGYGWNCLRSKYDNHVICTLQLDMTYDRKNEVTAKNAHEWNRLELLEEARRSSLSSDPVGALKAVDEVLRRNPDDLEALQLKGNLLEKDALEQNEFSSKRLSRSQGYLLARRCYESILEKDASNTSALLDIGDHYLHLDALDLAQTYYSRLLKLLKAGEFRTNWREEISDLRERTSVLLKSPRNASFGRELLEACDALLSQGSQGD